MSGNSSQPFSLLEEMCSCFNSTAGAISITSFSIIDITFVLPLCMIVLYLGFQRWQQQTPNTPMSHCDLLTYNMVLVDLLQIIGLVLSCCSLHADVPGLLSVGVCILWFCLSGQMVLFSLTCVDYYLAVVFPIVYLSLKQPKFIRARNITTGCLWLGNIMSIYVLGCLEHQQLIIFLSFITTLLLLFIIFSCFSVLYVLIRPGPGKGDRRQVAKSKLKAFNTMTVVLAVLTFRFLGIIVCNGIFTYRTVKAAEKCTVWLSLVCNSLPYSFLQPILFLQRTGKLPFCKNNM